MLAAFGLPGGFGSNAATSALLTKLRPPTSSVRSRPFPTSLAMACRETFRSRAASAWEIHSPGWIDLGFKLVVFVNVFLATMHRYMLAATPVRPR